HMLDDGPHLRAFRGARRAQDRHHRRAAGHVIDVHRREAALVVMRVPERKLLTSMRRAERVVDVEDLLLARLHCRAGLINPSRGASVLRGAFSRRLIVDCEASGEPVVGQRPTATFINGSCRSRSRSMASSWPHAIADTRATGAAENKEGLDRRRGTTPEPKC